MAGMGAPEESAMWVPMRATRSRSNDFGPGKPTRSWIDRRGVCCSHGAMAPPGPGSWAALLLLVAASMAGAQEQSPPAQNAPQGGSAPPAAHGGNVPPAAQGAPASPTAPQNEPPSVVLGAPASPPAEGAPARVDVPPVREAPRAHVSIVSPGKSKVLKRQSGTRTQDGGGLDDGAAEDVPEGPTVERLE